MGVLRSITLKVVLKSREDNPPQQQEHLHHGQVKNPNAYGRAASQHIRTREKKGLCIRYILATVHTDSLDYENSRSCATSAFWQHDGHGSVSASHEQLIPWQPACFMTPGAMVTLMNLTSSIVGSPDKS